MEKNVGNLDKALRYIAAFLLIGLGYFFNMPLLYIIAVIPLLTAIVSFCPLYTLIGVKTCKAKALPKKKKR